jgi:NADH-quinone oxidoreductase subunit M
MVGTFLQSWLAVAFAVTGVVLGALYMLWTYERVMWGPITNKLNEAIADMTGREISVMIPLLALMIVMGLYPRFLISRMEPSVAEVLARVHSAQVQLDREHRQNRLAEIAPSLEHAAVALVWPAQNK